MNPGAHCNWLQLVVRDSLRFPDLKVPTKILPIYERSPYYIGTHLWNNLPKSVQDSRDVFAFKKEIRRMNRVYVKL